MHCIHLHINSFYTFFPYTGIRARGCLIFATLHSCVPYGWGMTLKTHAFCHPEQIPFYNQFVRFQCPHLSGPPSHTWLMFLLTMFYMIIPWVFNSIFLSLKKNTFSSFRFCYQSTEAFDSKAKQKANTWGQITPSVERNCACGLKNWVKSQEENDVDFLAQTEEKSRSIFSTSQVCHCPFKALTVGVWWSLCNTTGTELTFQWNKELSIWESVGDTVFP